MNEFVSGFRSQSGICRCHGKDIEIGIEVKRSGFCPPVPTELTTSPRRGNRLRTHATASGHRTKGWVPVGNILIVLTRTGALNLRAARREVPDGSRVHHSSNMKSRRGQEKVSVAQVGVCRLARESLFGLTWRGGVSQIPLLSLSLFEFVSP